MSPVICPESGRKVVDVEILVEGQIACPRCGRNVILFGDRIGEHRLPGRAA
jgi:hypothetical protein